LPFAAVYRNKSPKIDQLFNWFGMV